MPLLRIANFAQNGLNTDLNPIDLPGSFLTEFENVQVMDGALHPFGGSTELVDTPAGSIPAKLYFVKSDLTAFWVIACDNKIYHYKGTFVDVTPTAGISINNSKFWTLTSLSDISIVNHPEIGPMYKSSANATYVDLPWDKDRTWGQAQQSAEIIAVHKQFMFALRITDSNNERTDAVRWSAPADVGSIPPTWDPLDTTSTAGLVNLGGTGGNILMTKGFVLLKTVYFVKESFTDFNSKMAVVTCDILFGWVTFVVFVPKTPTPFIFLKTRSSFDPQRNSFSNRCEFCQTLGLVLFL